MTDSFLMNLFIEKGSLEIINITQSNIGMLSIVLELTNRLNKLFIFLVIISLGLIASLIIEIYIDYRLRKVETFYTKKFIKRTDK